MSPSSEFQSADLEISLHRRDGTTYAVEFRFSLPGSEADIRPGQGQAEFDLNALRAMSQDINQYGKSLTETLFADPEVKSVFDQARAAAGVQDVPLRLRLIAGPSAPELHSLYWETLRDPGDGSPLSASSSLLFSRYLTSQDWRPVRLRPKTSLRALVVIANPANLKEYDLADVDAAKELENIRQALKGIPITTLPQAGKRASLADLVAELQANEYDMLYLVAHGILIRDEPWLFLEDENGQAARVRGAELATRIKELTQRPRLIVLASCQSAVDKGAGILSALGPRLAEVGVPAVVAMQGNVSIDTASPFMAAFFSELQRDGQVDRAMAVARGKVRDRSDYWMPALFMRLRSGRIWYVPGFKDPNAFKKWPSLLASIESGACTPILGPGLFEPLIGSQREIAQRWAETFHFPMYPQERESLPQVAQFLAVDQDPNFLRVELDRYLRRYMQDLYRDSLPPDMLKPFSPLDKLFQAVNKVRVDHQMLDSYKLLAEFPLPVYITSNLNNLLAEALVEVGKDPQVVICPWNQDVLSIETIYQREPDYEPTPERPLVYHLFGRLNQPKSVVLTEDDYFRYMIGVTKNKKEIPSTVLYALSSTALLFLGFQLDDWNFRVLFQSLLFQEGREALKGFSHIAAQIEPEEGRFLDPESARRYLETYYFNQANLSVYWGTTEDFMKELSQRLTGG
jgi:hypothetical protein